HGAPTFFIRAKRSFLMVLPNHHGAGRFPFTTPFRSTVGGDDVHRERHMVIVRHVRHHPVLGGFAIRSRGKPAKHRMETHMPDDRSEEHTSELQSLAYVVFYLLLEKIKGSAAGTSVVQ